MRKKKIHTPIARLMEVFDLGSDEVTHYLDIESGKLAIHSNISGAFDEDGNEIKGTNPFHNKNISKYREYLHMKPFWIWAVLLIQLKIRTCVSGCTPD